MTLSLPNQIVIVMKYQSVTQFLFDKIILQHPKSVICCVLAVVVFSVFQARNFRMDASADTLVLENDESLRYSRLISERYEEHDSLILTYTPNENMFSEKTLAALARLRDDLRSLERVVSFRSILDVPLLESPAVSLEELTYDLPSLD